MPTLPLDCCGGRLTVFRVDVGQDNGRALQRQCSGDGPTDSLRCAGDESNLVSEPVHEELSPSRLVWHREQLWQTPLPSLSPPAPPGWPMSPVPSESLRSTVTNAITAKYKR